MVAIVTGLIQVHNDAMQPTTGADGESAGEEDDEEGDVFLARSATDAASAVLRRCLLRRSGSVDGKVVVLDAATAGEAHARIVQAQTGAGRDVPEAFKDTVGMLLALPAAGLV